MQRKSCETVINITWLKQRDALSSYMALVKTMVVLAFSRLYFFWREVFFVCLLFGLLWNPSNVPVLKVSQDLERVALFSMSFVNKINLWACMQPKLLPPMSCCLHWPAHRHSIPLRVSGKRESFCMRHRVLWYCMYSIAVCGKGFNNGPDGLAERYNVELERGSV